MKKLKYLIVPLMLFSLILIGGMCEKESSRRSRDRDDEEEEELEEEEEEEEEEKKDVFTYKNTQWKFELDYPDTWEIEEMDDANGNLNLRIYSPLESPNDQDREMVVVVAESQPPQTFDESINQYIEIVKSEGEFLSSSKKTLKGHPAYEINYILDMGAKVKFSHYIIDGGSGTWYEIAYVALDTTYSKFLNDFQTILNSFTIY